MTVARHCFVNSGLAGPWNRGIIAHQTPHFRRPPKHVNNKGLLVFAQTFCTACFISLENLHIHSKTYVFSNTFDGFRPKYTFRGCLSKYRRTFIVYMFRRPPEVWSLMSDNTLISGTGKVGMYMSASPYSCTGLFFHAYDRHSHQILLEANSRNPKSTILLSFLLDKSEYMSFIILFQNEAYAINTLLIPQQVGTADSCQMTDAGALKLDRHLSDADEIVLGWIHVSTETRILTELHEGEVSWCDFFSWCQLTNPWTQDRTDFAKWQ